MLPSLVAIWCLEISQEAGELKGGDNNNKRKKN